MIGFLRTKAEHGLCPGCHEALPHHVLGCKWTTICANPDPRHRPCPFLEQALAVPPLSVWDPRTVPWRYHHDDWTFAMFSEEPVVGQRVSGAVPCGHGLGTVVGKRSAGCIVIRCHVCERESAFHMPGCRGICKRDYFLPDSVEWR